MTWKKIKSIKVSPDFYNWLLGQHTGHDKTMEGTLRRLLKLKPAKTNGRKKKGESK